MAQNMRNLVDLIRIIPRKESDPSPDPSIKKESSLRCLGEMDVNTHKGDCGARRALFR